MQTTSQDRPVIHTTPDDWTDPSSTRRERQTTKNPLTRVLALIGGVLLVLIGIPLLVLPGPGLACIAAGIALIAGTLGFKSKDGARSQ